MVWVPDSVSHEPIEITPKQNEALRGTGLAPGKTGPPKKYPAGVGEIHIMIYIFQGCG